MSRTNQVAKNVLAGTIGQLLTIIFGFATRTVFIYTLSVAYLGLNGLFTSLLTVLNLSELGIGLAITYALYKPIATNDHDYIKALMSFYSKAYRLVGTIVLAAGIVVLPFLDKLVSGDTELVNIRIVFMLFVVESAASYWLFAYKQTLLEANQEKYIVTTYNTIMACILSIIRIALLIILRDCPEIAFYSYTAVGIVGQLVINVLIGRAADKRFEYLKEKNKRNLTKEEKMPIFKNVSGVFVSKFSSIMITSIDNILISAFISISSVGVYSNYILLKTYITKPINIVFDSITASVGDYCATESLEKQEEFFHAIQFTYFWIFGFCSICLWILYNPFIGGVWINEDYLLSETAVFLIVINFLLDGLSGAVIKFRVAHGLYWQAKLRYLFSAVVNGALSYILIKPLGIEGVLLGTTASIIIMISLDPIIVYKNVFHKSAARYYLSYLTYLLLVIATGFLVTIISIPFKRLTIANFVIKLIICIIVPNGIWYVIFRKNKNLNYLKHYIFTVFNTIKRIAVKKGALSK